MGAIAMYLRLSLEDEKDLEKGYTKDESNSISNQRIMITDYIHHDPELRKYEVMEFCDDGYSGTSMDRPGMNELLKEVKANKISCIIVKDMSRFARDYIELGTYLNQIFPFMGIRFIAINDHYDSKDHVGTTIEIDTAFKTLLYDMYSKDVSVKVKASFMNKCANGEYVFGQAPFGYEKSRSKKNTVIVKEDEAVIVRKIFQFALTGMTSTQIAKQLYKDGVPTIMMMRRPECVPKNGKVVTWSSCAVRKILNNRFYLGEMIYGRRTQKSVGSRSMITLPEEEWKVIPNHHEALITPEEFAQVSLEKKNVSTKRRGKKNPLVGKLFCGGCGYSMNYKPIRKSNRNRRFECRKHSLLQIEDCCTCFKADILEELVLSMLNKELMQRASALEQQSNIMDFNKGKKDSMKRRLAEVKAEIKRLEASKAAIYEKYATSEVSALVYRSQSDQVKETLSLLSVNERELKDELELAERICQCFDEDMKQVIRYVHMEELTQEVVDTFIKKIYVYMDKRISIEWNYRDDVQAGLVKIT